ncbi:LTA synthase family protein [Muribaculum intestinale]|uniref:LTA synthase family protein n=1 Tax=Muribaculum intestinale TaxID=1796646 RepID=UPI00242BA69F|nr:LTA synthase family protein [Muribaculum intestinale]
MAQIRRISCNIWIATLWQCAVAFVLLWLSRVVFMVYDCKLSGADVGYMCRLMWQGIPFDLSAWAYFNALFVVMRFIPAPFVASRGWLLATDVVYIITNSLLLCINIADVAMFPFQGSRMRFAAIKSFFTDSNLGGIFLSYSVEYWWAFAMATAIVLFMIWLYRRVRPAGLPKARTSILTGLMRGGVFIAVAAVVVVCMRGRLSVIGKGLKPADAARGVERLDDMNVVLNTPFNIIHSLKDRPLEVPEYFTEEELAAIRPDYEVVQGDGRDMSRRNVMLIVIESGGQHWIDRLNNARDTAPRGLMPFLDSLASESLVVRYNFTTGRRSNEGLTAILGGFPMFEPFIYMGSPYESNTVDAMPALLRRKGYATKYYCGSNHGSFAIDQMAMMMGMQSVADRETYADDRDFDGVWGIYDHAMARYVASDLSDISAPWMACWFTLSSHAPFRVPEYWRTDGYLSQAGSMERSMEYVDRSLSYFFETARRQPWYDNTLFVITGDHGCRDLHGTVYDTPWLYSSIPMIIYDPSGEIAPPGEINDRVMSQVDTGATILGLLGYDEPYVSMGRDILHMSSAELHYAIYKGNNVYHIISPRLVVKWDGIGDIPLAVYDVTVDDSLEHPVDIAYNMDMAVMADSMITYAKAYLQDFTQRLVSDRLHR